MAQFIDGMPGFRVSLGAGDADEGYGFGIGLGEEPGADALRVFTTAEIAAAEGTVAGQVAGAAGFLAAGALGSDLTLKTENFYGTVGTVLADTQTAAGMVGDSIIQNIRFTDLDHPDVFVANTLAGLGMGEPMMVIQPVGQEILPGLALPAVPALPVPDLGFTQPALPPLSLPVLPEVTLPQIALPELGGIAGPPEPAPDDPLVLVSDTLAGLGAADPQELVDGRVSDLGADGLEDTMNQTLTGLGSEDLLQTVFETTTGLGLF